MPSSRWMSTPDHDRANHDETGIGSTNVPGCSLLIPPLAQSDLRDLDIGVRVVFVPLNLER